MAGGPTMTLQEAAERLQLHYMTVYRYVRLGRLPATRQGVQWRVRVADVDALLDRRPDQPRGLGDAQASALEQLESRMLAGDSSGAWWLIETRLSGGVDPAGVLTNMLVPTLRSIGDRWAMGDLSIADEHRATAVAERVVGRLGLQFGRPGRHRGTVALAAPSGDIHSLPVAIVADLLRWRGFEILELGSNTPAEALGEAVGSVPLVAVGIVSSTNGLEAEVAAAVAAAHASAPDVAITLGGAAVEDESHVRHLGADVWTGRETTTAVDTIEQTASRHRQFHFAHNDR